MINVNHITLNCEKCGSSSTFLIKVDSIDDVKHANLLCLSCGRRWIDVFAI